MNPPSWYRLVPPTVLEARLSRATALCTKLGVEGVLLTHGPDIYWLTGTMQQGVAALTCRGEVLVLIRREPARARVESPFPVIEITGLSQAGGLLRELFGPKAKVGMCMEVVSARALTGWQQRLEGRTLVDVGRRWLDMLAVKDEWEIERIAACGALAREVYRQLPRIVREGVSELEVAGGLLGFAIAKGHLDLLRTREHYMPMHSWHVVGGELSTVRGAIDAAFAGWGTCPAMPQGAAPRPIAKGEPLIVDMGICLEGYQSDQTRTCLIGSAPPRVQAAAEFLVEVQELITAELQPGAISGDIYEQAMALARKRGMEPYFLGTQEKLKFVGHGLGIELGTPPYLQKNSGAKVRAGEVYALELKMVLPEGPVGLENTYAVSHTGPPRLLTPVGPDGLWIF